MKLNLFVNIAKVYGGNLQEASKTMSSRKNSTIGSLKDDSKDSSKNGVKAGLNSSGQSKLTTFSRIDWPISIFLVVVHLSAITVVPWYLYTFGTQGSILLFGLVFALLTNLSITAGYHRLFSHKSYEAHPVVRALLLLIGASAFQASVLKWASDHRQHHRFVDTNRDPYNIKQGFWYAHMGWLFLADSTNKNPKLPDLEKDWMVRLQHQHYVLIAILTGFIFPTLVGWMLGSALGGFLVGGVFRIALTQQTTFFVNSLCHTLGTRPYSLDVTARDSLIVAFLTHGEGYHNFHHQFPYDYRNGIKWHQWDPTRWTIDLLAKFHLVTGLKSASQEKILRARLQVELLKGQEKGYAEEFLVKIQDGLLSTSLYLENLKKRYKQMEKPSFLVRFLKIKRPSSQMWAQEKEKILLEMRQTRLEFKSLKKQWRSCVLGVHPRTIATSS